MVAHISAESFYSLIILSMDLPYVGLIFVAHDLLDSPSFTDTSKLQTLMSHSSPHPLAWHLADSTLVPVPAQPSNFEVAASDDLPGAATTHWRETSSNYLRLYRCTDFEIER
ncbi:hypothetical protein BGAL_0060g00030 [Botrytis galanthina]|uniref:Uncharacterized protein n=1 Tax=Botrytis galanthina TaxID=278940 RepID=A0A4S8R567_9HELO|nr:hypothetical protein BGAL_0060g00030 [Botrytis galanthina]